MHYHLIRLSEVFLLSLLSIIAIDYMIMLVVFVDYRYTSVDERVLYREITDMLQCIRFCSCCSCFLSFVFVILYGCKVIDWKDNFSFKFAIVLIFIGSLVVCLLEHRHLM